MPCAIQLLRALRSFRNVAEQHDIVTYMGERCGLRRHLSKGVDVYAYGVLMWELWTSSGAWAGLSQAQVIAAVLVRRRSLEFPPGMPHDYQVRNSSSANPRCKPQNLLFPQFGTELSRVNNF